jgi:(1->4)-alpha-D-glucan 1-alpha-D-glucosylmutase
MRPHLMKRVVTATYRLQLTRAFPFARARELVPYFEDLGVSHL